MCTLARPLRSPADHIADVLSDEGLAIRVGHRSGLGSCLAISLHSAQREAAALVIMREKRRNGCWQAARHEYSQCGKRQQLRREPF